MDDIPDELLEQILKYSNNYESVNLVNKRFNYLTTKADLCSGSLEKLNRCLVKASKEGDLELVHALLDKGANSYHLSMSYAARYGHINILRYIINYISTLVSVDYDTYISIASNYVHVP